MVSSLHPLRWEFEAHPPCHRCVYERPLSFAKRAHFCASKLIAHYLHCPACASPDAVDSDVVHGRVHDNLLWLLCVSTKGPAGHPHRSSADRTCVGIVGMARTKPPPGPPRSVVRISPLGLVLGLRALCVVRLFPTMSRRSFLGHFPWTHRLRTRKRKSSRHNLHGLPRQPARAVGFARTTPGVACGWHRTDCGIIPRARALRRRGLMFTLGSFRLRRAAAGATPHVVDLSLRCAARRPLGDREGSVRLLKSQGRRHTRLSSVH